MSEKDHTTEWYRARTELAVRVEQCANNERGYVLGKRTLEQRDDARRALADALKQFEYQEEIE